MIKEKLIVLRCLATLGRGMASFSPAAPLASDNPNNIHAMFVGLDKPSTNMKVSMSVACTNPTAMRTFGGNKMRCGIVTGSIFERSEAILPRPPNQILTCTISLAQCGISSI